MQVVSPTDGKWYEVSGTTTAQIAHEMNLPRTTGWSYKVNGEVRKSLGTVHEGDTVELIDDTETVQSSQTETVSATSGSDDK